MNNEHIKKAVDYLSDKYEGHSVILYGSYANGDFTEESDLDLMIFSDFNFKRNDTSRIDGLLLDAWIHPTSSMDDPARFLHIHDSVIVTDSRGLAAPFLEKIQSIFAKGPEKLGPDEADFQKAWLQKMLKRAGKGDAEGDFRYHWMLTDSLEIYFKLKGRWYWGPKKSLKWLEQHEPGTYLLFRKALSPLAGQQDVSELFGHIVES
ncbi:nucleotidyltransferase domain-containing protein [Paenibacillus sp. GbtcB18]|uniref:nucleotidyltransferase domain-containing protein n=1 Tax=Paenibacillus sp. GbtcB18 TaxID=2824763 RepID=UPI001C30BEEB|nr:nucleotidyltransferase domain-containing protein [Paenibacillus sp. GbtcB18]